MKTFKDLTFVPHSTIHGFAARLNFENGYGVSVIKGLYSYGGSKNLYELAIFKGNHLCYDTEITNDVLGYLTEEDVTKYMEQVQNLPNDQKMIM